MMGGAISVRKVVEADLLHPRRKLVVSWWGCGISLMSCMPFARLLVFGLPVVGHNFLENGHP